MIFSDDWSKEPISKVAEQKLEGTFGFHLPDRTRYFGVAESNCTRAYMKIAPLTILRMQLHFTFTEALAASGPVRLHRAS